jgi:hypothetical protein
MRVLFINSYTNDYQQELIYNGLVEILGEANVVDYPFNIHYHFKHRKYPTNLGYSPKSPINFIKSRLKYNIDLVIIGSAKKDCFESYLNVVDKIPDHVPVVFLDGGDSPEIGGDLFWRGQKDVFDKCMSKRPFDLVFKREYYIGSKLGERVIPFPFSFNFNAVKNIELNPQNFKYDVSFWATESNIIRTNVFQLLRHKFDCNKNGSVTGKGFLSYTRRGQDYLNEIKACKIVLNFRGGGWDTLRYWEVPACGRFLISGEPRIIIPNNFTNGENIIYCKDDLSDLIDLCIFYIKNDDARESIARKSFEHLKRYHSNVARAKFLLKTTKDILKLHV